ncbi:MAG: DUF1667 domain-containing protein [Lachnospiraceae bacterium]|nr:DUF1667 domain-containing protein [Lachnospiraceae bacterium]
MAEYTCIVCPLSCQLTVSETGDGEVTVSGNGCRRGEIHGKNEYLNPMRMITTTVVVSNREEKRLAVISQGEVPKKMVSECLKEIYRTVVEAPVSCGDVILKDICHTGVDIVSTVTIE